MCTSERRKQLLRIHRLTVVRAVGVVVHCRSRMQYRAGVCKESTKPAEHSLCIRIRSDRGGDWHTARQINQRDWPLSADRLPLRGVSNIRYYKRTGVSVAARLVIAACTSNNGVLQSVLMENQ